MLFHPTHRVLKPVKYNESLSKDAEKIACQHKENCLKLVTTLKGTSVFEITNKNKYFSAFKRKKELKR